MVILVRTNSSLVEAQNLKITESTKLRKRKDSDGRQEGRQNNYPPLEVSEVSRHVKVIVERQFLNCSCRVWAY